MSRKELITSKLSNFVLFISGVFPHNSSIQGYVSQFKSVPVELVISTIKTQWSPYSTEDIIKSMVEQFKIDIDSVPLEDKDKFKRYIDMFKELCNF